MGNILIVDDQPGVRYLLYELFTAEGYQVQLAKDGYEAIELVGESDPSLIFMDMRMPGISGIETIERLNRSEAKNTVLMTAYGENELVQKAKKLGVQYNIEKPFELESIKKLAKMILEGK
ncbi:two-component system response regulator (stage 0 sporulation protein F) [Desulfitispora alkaliphila]|uniref:response regulator n=1 Tax=Desulfitispora alkaliphila TaxID=622674 RepID=UPI003D198399